MHNGVEKYKINWEQCYRLRAYVSEFWETCLTCVTVCPYTKPKVWWHDLSVQTLKRTPLSLRWLTVRTLKLIDDVFWGSVPEMPVKWVGYDSGIMPVKKKRNAAANGDGESGSSGHGGHGALPDPKSKVGYYYPLKGNTRQFEIMKERAEKAGRSK